ncbi:hypothetical protein BGZ60DRAFT_524767 [Tricladium varicosporioides]|nr:hypothetical protein BGZ60DRAFT_524767 [Hymenoscyphus varicosporioides]
MAFKGGFLCMVMITCYFLAFCCAAIITAAFAWFSGRRNFGSLQVTEDSLLVVNYAHEHTDYAHEHTDYAPWHTEIVDFQFFCDLDHGIGTALYDWWLSDINFFLDCEEFREWRDVMEDSMIWNLIEFWETWHDVDGDGAVKELSAKETLSYDEEKTGNDQ